jgi:aminoglycoside/choline kinase family phosphotransferase
VGLVGLLYRITPQYLNEHSSFPATLIVKLPVLIDATRQVAAAYRLYEKEVAFYKDLAHLTKIATPGLIHAAHDPATDNFVLALEDLGHLRSADQLIGCAPDDARAAVTALARHHSAFWDEQGALANEYPWLPYGSDFPTPLGVQLAFAAYWPAFVEFMGEELDPRMLPLGDWIPENVEDLLSPPEGRAVTVLHGDYRLDNLFFDEERNVTALDSEVTVKGPPGYDFAYFLSQSLSVEGRRSQLDHLADVYLSTLEQEGVAYDRDDFWHDVRRSLVFCLFYPIQCMAYDFTDPRVAVLVREMATRSTSAILDLDALRLLD